jgi:hypothetical protein
MSSAGMLTYVGGRRIAGFTSAGGHRLREGVNPIEWWEFGEAA